MYPFDKLVLRSCLVASTADMSLWADANTGYLYDVALHLSLVLPSVLGTRLLFNLREIADQHSHYGTESEFGRVSTMAFDRA